MCTETVFWSGCHMENRRNISTNARGRGGSRAGSFANMRFPYMNEQQNIQERSFL